MILLKFRETSVLTRKRRFRPPPYPKTPHESVMFRPCLARFNVVFVRQDRPIYLLKRKGEKIRLKDFDNLFIRGEHGKEGARGQRVLWNLQT